MNVLPFPDLPAPVTVAEVIDLYLEHTRHQQAPRTYSERRRILEAFRAGHGVLRLDQARPYHLRFWIDGNEGWKSDWTRQRVARTVLRAFNWCKRIGRTAANPFEGGLPYPAGDRGRPMAEATWRACLGGSDALFRRVLLFLRLTGCRPGEMSALEPRHLQLEPGADRGVASLDRHKTSRKTRKPRVIVLHPIAVRLIRWQLARMLPNQKHLFLNAKGRPWDRNSLGLRMSRLRARLGIDPAEKLYGLRHSFITRGILADVPIATMAELAGHTSTTTTEIYIHLARQTGYLGQAVLKIFEGGPAKG